MRSRSEIFYNNGSGRSAAQQLNEFVNNNKIKVVAIQEGQYIAHYSGHSSVYPALTLIYEEIEKEIIQ